MLIFVLTIPTFVISVLTGLILSITSTVTNKLLIAGSVVGLLLGEVILSALLPTVVGPQPGDFSSIVSNYFVSGAYGMTLGLLAAIFFRWMVRLK